MTRLIATISLVLTAVIFTGCHRTYYDDTVRTPRGKQGYHDSYSSRPYQKKRVKMGDSYASEGRTKVQQEYRDSYSTKSKKSSGSKYKDSYSSGHGKKRRLRFYDSFSSKKRKNIFLSK
ncbi:MAG: hypothetical protein NT150_13635 [Bacteroidetes bacterium]|nr:hypothetical protein [Bacteroidota bacterium]